MCSRYLAEARRIIEAWRIDYNTVRPHSSLGYLTPEEFAANWRAAHREQQPDAAPLPAPKGKLRTDSE